MALKKQMVQASTGAKAEYIEMIGINYNKRKELSELIVGVWVSKQEYDANLEPVLTIINVIPSGSAPELASGAYAFTMNYIKSLPEFEGAEEVEEENA